MRRAAVILCLVLLVVGAWRAFRPPLTDKRDVIVSTPSVQGLFVRAVAELPRRGLGCVEPVPLDPEMTSVQVIVNSGDLPTVPLTVTAHAPGYRAVGRVPARDYTPGIDAPVRVALDAPGRRVDGRLCVRNRGRRSLLLVGTNEPRSRSTPVLAINGKKGPDVDVAVTFFGDRGESVADDPGSVLDQAGSFTGGYVPQWLAWVLVFSLLLGVPAVVVVTFAWALRRDAAGS
jgi:hypothetical protein